MKPEPPPDAYISPHAVVSSQPTRQVPVFEYTEDLNGVQRAFQTGYRTVIGPHQEWINARDKYAEDPEQHPLDTVLMHVTEDNPPPGPPIPVYKPKAEPEKPLLHRRGIGLSVLGWSVFVGIYIPYGEHGNFQLSLFIIIAVLWMIITWEQRRAAHGRAQAAPQAVPVPPPQPEPPPFNPNMSLIGYVKRSTLIR